MTDKTRRAIRNSKLIDKYGMTLVEYERMLAKQGFKCYICKVSFESKKPNVDHHHGTWTVRAILCVSCNARVSSVEKNKPECRHHQRRFDKAPYREYLREFAPIVADVDMGA